MLGRQLGKQQTKVATGSEREIVWCWLMLCVGAAKVWRALDSNIIRECQPTQLWGGKVNEYLLLRIRAEA
jgi:hypothetical protein